MMMVPRGAAIAAALMLAAPALAGNGRLTARPSAAPLVAPGFAPGATHRLSTGALLYVPAGRAPGELYPLLLLFPGTGGTGDTFVKQLKPVADARKIALLGVTPLLENFDAVHSFFDAYDTHQKSALARWPRPVFGRDAAAIDRALAEVFAGLDVDPAHLGLLGFSHGASYALQLGTANPQLFTSVGALSPGILVVDPAPASGQSIFLAHGRADPVQPFRRTACAMVPRLHELGFAVAFDPFAGGHAMPVRSIAAAILAFEDGRRARPAEPPALDPTCR